MEVSAVQFAVMLMTNEPEAGTTFFTEQVASLVLGIAKTIEVADTVEFVTVTVFDPAAIFTVPAGLLIV